MTTAPSTRTPSGTRDASPEAPDRIGPDTGLLVIRCAVGLTMAGHGTQKLFGWFKGSGLDGTADNFAAGGYKAADTMAVVAALTETVGGLGLVLGLLTPLAAAGIIGIMLNALATKWGDGYYGFFGPPAGAEYDLILLAAATGLALAGPGRWAADQLLPVLRRHRLTHGIGAVLLGCVSAGLVLWLGRH